MTGAMVVVVPGDVVKVATMTNDAWAMVIVVAGVVPSGSSIPGTVEANSYTSVVATASEAKANPAAAETSAIPTAVSATLCVCVTGQEAHGCARRDDERGRPNRSNL